MFLSLCKAMRAEHRVRYMFSAGAGSDLHVGRGGKLVFNRTTKPKPRYFQYKPGT